jgi:hypothetical protein
LVNPPPWREPAAPLAEPNLYLRSIHKNQPVTGPEPGKKTFPPGGSMHLVGIVAVTRIPKPRIVLFGGTDPEFLRCAREQIIDHVAGRLDHPTAKARLRRFLGAQGYKPAPDDKGTINDFEGDDRLDLILQANFRLERGYLRWEKGQT